MLSFTSLWILIKFIVFWGSLSLLNYLRHLFTQLVGRAGLELLQICTAVFSLCVLVGVGAGREGGYATGLCTPMVSLLETKILFPSSLSPVARSTALSLNPSPTLPFPTWRQTVSLRSLWITSRLLLPQTPLWSILILLLLCLELSSVDDDVFLLLRIFPFCDTPRVVLCRIQTKIFPIFSQYLHWRGRPQIVFCLPSWNRKSKQKSIFKCYFKTTISVKLHFC